MVISLLAHMHMIWILWTVAENRAKNGYYKDSILYGEEECNR